MMRKTITRTMCTSTVHAYTLSIVDGKPVAKELEPVVVMGKAKEKDALKVLKDKYGSTTAITVGKIQVEESTYEISVEDFVKYATKVEKGTTAKEEPETATN